MDGWTDKRKEKSQRSPQPQKLIWIKRKTFLQVFKYTASLEFTYFLSQYSLQSSLLQYAQTSSPTKVESLRSYQDWRP